jgi:protein pelota
MERDDSRSTFKVRVDSIDDLWYLDRAVIPGTRVAGYTFRKLEAKDDQVRPDSQPRVRVYLRIEVESTEFHPFTDSLRIKGRVIEGPHDISGHHTFNVDPGTVLDLELVDEHPEIVAVLEEAQESSTRARAIAVSLDDETATVFRLRDYGIEDIGTIRTGSGGKRYLSGSRWDAYYDDICDLLMSSLTDETQLLIVGPGFFKEVLSKKLREERSIDSGRIHVVPSSSGGLSGIKEALSGSAGLSGMIEELRFARESELLNNLMAGIGKGQGSAYGEEEVKRALEMGAVETLLVTDEIFKKGSGRELITLAHRMGSGSMVVSSVHDQGSMFQKMGGIGAILRFDI